MSYASDKLKELDKKIGEMSPLELKCMVLETERDSWKSLAERLAGALEFYGNRKNYESLDINRATGNSVYDILLHDFDRDLEPRKDYAGRRAREALADYEKVVGE